MQTTRETESEISVLDQLADLAATIRGGKRVELAPAASQWEMRLRRQQAKLTGYLKLAAAARGAGKPKGSRAMTRRPKDENNDNFLGASPAT